MRQRVVVKRKLTRHEKGFTPQVALDVLGRVKAVGVIQLHGRDSLLGAGWGIHPKVNWLGGVSHWPLRDAGRLTVAGRHAGHPGHIPHKVEVAAHDVRDTLVVAHDILVGVCEVWVEAGSSMTRVSTGCCYDVFTS